MKKKTFLWLAFGSLVVFTLAGGLIHHYFGNSGWFEYLPGKTAWTIQVAWGIFLGLFWGILAWKLVCIPYLATTRKFFQDIFGPMQLSFGQIIFISFCAGIGEELLFRGAIQPLWGIWITALLFVAIHGYLNPVNLPLSLYGLLMILAIASMGYAAAHTGLLSAVVAHIIIDIILLQRLSTVSRTTIPEDILQE